MKPLPDKFDELEDLLLNYRATLAQNSGVPFIRLVYRPEEEHECRRCRQVLARTLKQKRIPLVEVSCQDIIFAYYEQRNLLEQLFDMDRNLESGLREHITKSSQPVLVERLASAVAQLGNDGVIFLRETAHLYPYLSLTATLEHFTNRIVAPMALVIFYPGEVDIDKRLMFLGVRPSGYYRTRDLI